MQDTTGRYQMRSFLILCRVSRVVFAFSNPFSFSPLLQKLIIKYKIAYEQFERKSVQVCKLFVG